MPGKIATKKAVLRGLLAGGLACLLAVPPGAQAAGKKEGVRVLVTIRPAAGEAGGESGEISGELVGVRTDALVVGLEAGETRTVAMTDVARIRVHRRSRALLGAVVGGLAVGAAGVALAVGKRKPGDAFLDNVSEAVITGGVGALLGGGLGAMIGSQFGGDRTYDLTNMSGAQIEALMAKLRKAARVSDYQ
jgi:hypothetical protein